MNKNPKMNKYHLSLGGYLVFENTFENIPLFLITGTSTDKGVLC